MLEHPDLWESVDEGSGLASAGRGGSEIGLCFLEANLGANLGVGLPPTPSHMPFGPRALQKTPLFLELQSSLDLLDALYGNTGGFW